MIDPQMQTDYMGQAEGYHMIMNNQNQIQSQS